MSKCETIRKRRNRVSKRGKVKWVVAVLTVGILAVFLGCESITESSAQSGTGTGYKEILGHVNRGAYTPLVIRFVDDEAQVACWISVKESMMWCMPIDQTGLGKNH